jgi:hypothetical protein
MSEDKENQKPTDPREYVEKDHWKYPLDGPLSGLSSFRPSVSGPALRKQ